MIQITPQMRILVAVEPADFRKGVDGLARLCRQALQDDPFSGALFVFRNRRRTSLKLLCYDGQGFWLCQKRLSQGRFRFWPNSTEAAQDFQNDGNVQQKARKAHLGAHLKVPALRLEGPYACPAEDPADPPRHPTD